MKVLMMMLVEKVFLKAKIVIENDVILQSTNYSDLFLLNLPKIPVWPLFLSHPASNTLLDTNFSKSTNNIVIVN